MQKRMEQHLFVVNNNVSAHATSLIGEILQTAQHECGFAFFCKAATVVRHSPAFNAFGVCKSFEEDILLHLCASHNFQMKFCDISYYKYFRAGSCPTFVAIVPLLTVIVWEHWGSITGQQVKQNDMWMVQYESTTNASLLHQCHGANKQAKTVWRAPDFIYKYTVM